jgi:ABC-2 type transport system permease protein
LLVVTVTLARVQFKLRYFDSALSYLWTIARPLALFGVLYLFFTQLTGLDNGVENYQVYLLASVVLWTFFSEGTASGLYALVHNESMLRKLPLPRIALPLSVVLTSFLDLCMNLIAVLGLALAFGISPRASWLELPALLLVLSVLVIGVSLLLSVLFVRFRDLHQIWLVLTMGLFYATPIFYVVTSLSEKGAQILLLVNPLATVLTEMRHALIDPSAPSAAEVIGSSVLLAVPLGIVVTTLALGAFVFQRRSPYAAENL